MINLRPEQKEQIIKCKLQHGDKVFTYETSITCDICKYKYFRTNSNRWISREDIISMSDELVQVLTTSVHERPFCSEQNWQANMARTLCSRLLKAAAASGKNGCRLCRS